VPGKAWDLKVWKEDALDIVIAGGTGFIGKALCDTLRVHGHRVTMLTRRPAEVQRAFGSLVRAVEWDARTPGVWEQSLSGAQAVVNLAGASIADARWTESRKRLLTESRVDATRLLVQACDRLAVKPRVLINASGVGFYGPQDDEVVDESHGPGQGFLAGLCVQWESAAREAASQGIRVISLRTGMVLEKDGGALPRLALPFRLFAGGPVRPGTQWVSWIHRDDLVGLIEWALTASTVSGPVNAVAPSPVTMAAFCKTLGRVLHRPSWFPIPEFVLKAALGELASIMTTGQKVCPSIALRNGYRFQYPFLEGALRAIYAKP
jgi:uncharacterized protein (TIGR01777 family)